MNVLESTLSALLLKATLILVAVVFAHFALRRASAATRHLCLAMAMFGVVFLPVLSLSLPVWQLEVLPQGSAALPGDASGSPIPFEEELDESGSSTPLALSSFRDSRVEGPATDGRFQPGLTEWLIVTWALGAALVLARLSAGLLRMRWIARNGVRVTDQDALRLLDECVNTLQLQVRPLLIASEHAGIPLAWGWLRPALIIPLGFGHWTPNRMRAVLLHELGHLKRNDWPVLVLGRIVAAFYWFHPLAWFVERCAKHECERACDDIVVTYGTKPSDYASHLLSIARGVSETPASVRAALAVVRRSQLNSRLQSILDPLLQRNNPSRTMITGLGATLLLVLVPLASLQLTEQAHANEPKTEVDLLLAQHEQKRQQKMQADLDSEASEGELAYKKGYKLHPAGRYEEAIEVWQEARDLGYKSAAATYNIACAYALMGDSRQAMNWLDRAFDAGFEGPETLVKDSDFDPIRKNSSFQAYIDRAFEAAGVERRAPDHYPYRTMLDSIDKLKASGSTNGKKWHYVGSKLLSMQEYDLAIEALTVAVENSGEKSSSSMYNLACAYSLAGNERQALEWLDRSVDAGFDQQERFINDPDLDDLRDNAQFQRIKDKSEFLSMDRLKQHTKDGSGRSTAHLAPVIDEYEAYVGNHPSSGRAWFNLGYALHLSERYDDAIDAWETSASLGYHSSTSNYNLACANSMLNNTDAALDALEIAVESGMFHHGGLEGDDDLDNLRHEPRFEALLERLEKEHEHEDEKKKQMQMQMKMRTKMEHREHDHDD
jgi:beta-lactamase regulating signal transducer with metallopeptidase domain